jgi:hypothetical protein
MFVLSYSLSSVENALPFPLPLQGCAGVGLVVVLYSPEPWFWLCFEAVRIWVNYLLYNLNMFKRQVHEALLQ